MFKSLTAILISLALLFGAAAFEWNFVENHFSAFGEEISSLCVKTEAETANGEDAKAVIRSWERRKESLHIFIPHNDVSRVDDYLAEASKLIAEKNYSLALAKLEILLRLSERLPAAYRPGIENIF